MGKQLSRYEYEGLKVELETDMHTLGEILEAVEYVLRGQGYFFDGNLAVVKEDE